MKKFSLTMAIVVTMLLLFTVGCVTREVPVTETYYETEYKTKYKTETYTEIQNVVVSTKEDRKYLKPVVRWNDNLSFGTIVGPDSTYYYGYVLNDWDFNPLQHSNVQVKVDISASAQQQNGTIIVYDMTGVGQIPPMPTPVYGWSNDYSYTNTYQFWFDQILIPGLSAGHVVGERHTGVGEEDYLIFDAKNMTDFAILVNNYNFYTISSVELTWSDEVIGQKTVTSQRQVPYQVPVQVEKQRTIMQTKKGPFWANS